MTVGSRDQPPVSRLLPQAARRAFDEGPWRRTSGPQRSRLLHRLADLLEQHADELALLESRDNGKPVHVAKNVDIALAVACYRYYAGWADKLQVRRAGAAWRGRGR